MREEIIKMAKAAGMEQDGDNFFSPGHEEIDVHITDLERFFHMAQAAEREKVANWMMRQGYATGHGDTVEDLLKELEWQVKEREREACAQVCDDLADTHEKMDQWGSYKTAEALSQAIRAREKS